SLDGSFRRDGYLLFTRGGTPMAQPFDSAHLALTGAAFPVEEGVEASGGFGYFSAAENGTLTYLSSSAPPPTQLIWKDRTGKTTGTFGLPGNYFNFRLSPDEMRITFNAVQNGNED